MGQGRHKKMHQATLKHHNSHKYLINSTITMETKIQNDQYRVHTNRAEDVRH